MTLRVHLKSASEPILTWGCDMQADCDATVPRSHQVSFRDSVAMGEAYEIPKGVCSKCRNEALKARYTYAICDERELRTEEELYVE